MDLSNTQCFLELDRFDRRIFKFGLSAPNLQSFTIRTGKSSYLSTKHFDENRYQAIRLLVNQSLEMHSTHDVDIVRIKTYLQELFPFTSEYMWNKTIQDKVSVLTRSDLRRLVNFSVENSFKLTLGLN